MATGPLKSRLSPRVYRSQHGARLAVVFLEPPGRGEVLLYFEDFEGSAWNGRVVLHERRGSGDREQYFIAGLDRPSAQLMWGTMRARPPDCDRDLFMYLDLTAPPGLDSREIIALFEQQQLAASGIEESRAAASAPAPSNPEP